MMTEGMLDGVQEALTAALADLDTRSALNEICRITRNLTRSDESYIDLLDETSQTRRREGGAGEGIQFGRSVPVQEGVHGYVICEGAEVRSSDLSSHSRTSGMLAGTRHAAIIVSIKARGKVLGCLATIRRKIMDDFTEEDVVPMRLLALVAAVAIALRS